MSKKSAVPVVTTESDKPMDGKKALALAGKTAVADIGNRLRGLANLKSDAALIKSPELIEKIIVRLLHGEAMLSISTDPDMPAMSTIHQWKRQDQEFRALVGWAQQEGMEVLFDAQLDIASGGTFSTGNVERDALLVKAINNVASKRNRNAFGDKVEVSKTTINYNVTKSENDW